MVDKVRVQQVLINLISNAIKFSQGNQQIEIAIEEEEIDVNSNNIGVKISVTDHGIGIDSEDRKNLFT